MTWAARRRRRPAGEARDSLSEGNARSTRTRRACNDALLLLLCAELRDAVVRPAALEAEDGLEVLALEVDVDAEAPGQLDGFCQRGGLDDVVHARGEDHAQVVGRPVRQQEVRRDARVQVRRDVVVVAVAVAPIAASMQGRRRVRRLERRDGRAGVRWPVRMRLLRCHSDGVVGREGVFCPGHVRGKLQLRHLKVLTR